MTSLNSLARDCETVTVKINSHIKRMKNYIPSISSVVLCVKGVAVCVVLKITSRQFRVASLASSRGEFSWHQQWESSKNVAELTNLNCHSFQNKARAKFSHSLSLEMYSILKTLTACDDWNISVATQVLKYKLNIKLLLCN